MSSSFGRLFTITNFGESHGQCVGILIDGCPAGLPLNENDIQIEVDKRKPISDSGQTNRREEDKVQILSGVFEGFTTGAPICLLVWNKDMDSNEYVKTRFIPRPGHADYTAFVKYGGFNDYRGGGRFSGRLTVGLVMAGAVAKKLLKTFGIEVYAHTLQIGQIQAKNYNLETIRKEVYRNPLRCADSSVIEAMEGAIDTAQKEGDSLGGIIESMVLNVPPGLGEPYFSTLEGEISKALYAIPAVKGVEFGEGFKVASLKGSQNNDAFIVNGDKISTTSNNSGGILGGISDGMPLVVRTAVKPTPSISLKQDSIDLNSKEKVELSVRGRHDVCIVPRAVPVVEAMIAVTLCDFCLQSGMIKRIMK
jgi:chorismate synthase